MAKVKTTGPWALARGHMGQRLAETRALRQELQQFGERQDKSKGYSIGITRKKDGTQTYFIHKHG